MIRVNVRAVPHTLEMGRTRGKRAPGGWRWVPMCSCGWNRKMWQSSSNSEDGAYSEWMDHLLADGVDCYGEKFVWDLTLVFHREQ